MVVVREIAEMADTYRNPVNGARQVVGPACGINLCVGLGCSFLSLKKRLEIAYWTDWMTMAR